MPKALEAVAGGWELSGNYRVQSGKAVVFSGPAFFCGRDFSVSRNDRSLSRWFDTTCFLPFPNSNTTLATLQAYPAWTGVQGMPGYGYVPVAGDTIKKPVGRSVRDGVEDAEQSAERAGVRAAGELLRKDFRAKPPSRKVSPRHEHQVFLP